MQHTKGRFTDTHLIFLQYLKKASLDPHDSSDLQSFVLYIDYMEYAARGTMNSWLDCINWHFRCHTETIIFLGLKVYHANLSSKKASSEPKLLIKKKKVACQVVFHLHVYLSAERKQMPPHPLVVSTAEAVLVSHHSL